MMEFLKILTQRHAQVGLCSKDNPCAMEEHNMRMRVVRDGHRKVLEVTTMPAYNYMEREMIIIPMDSEGKGWEETSKALVNMVVRGMLVIYLNKGETVTTLPLVRGRLRGGIIQRWERGRAV